MASPRHWAVVPAAGIGARMGAEVPKQYLDLGGRPLIAHGLERLCRHPVIAGVVVVLAAGDEWWPTVRIAADCPLLTVTGGAERCHSALNGLKGLEKLGAVPTDWVLVHDAARPCIRSGDITLLVEALQDHPAGGLLGLPVRDTMKRTDVRGEVVDTVSRENLWHALTPQMFFLGPLAQALESVLAAGGLVTDEAQAMELAGQRPMVVEGSADNIKVTLPADLELAALYLAAQERDGGGP